MLCQEQALEIKDAHLKAQNRMRGRLCGLIESMNLPVKQERAAIELAKNLSYDADQAVADLLFRQVSNL